MEHPHVAILRTVVNAFRERDWDTVYQYWADDLVIHYDGASPVAGSYRGRDEIMTMMNKIDDLTDGTFQVEIHDILGNDEHGIILYHEHAVRNGRRFDWNQIGIYHFRDGKFSEVWLHPTNRVEFDEFMSEPEEAHQ